MEKFPIRKKPRLEVPEPKSETPPSKFTAQMNSPMGPINLDSDEEETVDPMENDDEESEYDADSKDTWKQSFTSGIEIHDDFAEFQRLPFTPHDEEDVTIQILEVEDASRACKPTERNAMGQISPMLRIFGVTKAGQSVAIHVGFFPYLYFPCTANFSNNDLSGFLLAIKAGCDGKIEFEGAEIVERKPLLNYRVNMEDYIHYIKITLAHTSYMAKVTRLLSQADNQPRFAKLFSEGKLYDTQVYESNVGTLDLRFMVDLDLVGAGWLTVPAGKWQKMPLITRCGLNISCHASDIVAKSSDSSMAKLNCMAISVTMIADFITFITVIMTVNHSSVDSNDQTIVLCHSHLDYTASEPHVKVIPFKTEREMLHGFKNLFLLYDADVVFGYDVSDHLSRIVSRATELGLPQYAKFGRASQITKVNKKQIYNAKHVRQQRRMAATSNREFLSLRMVGRVVFDLRQLTERDYALRTYSFAEAVSVLLHRPKEVLSDNEIATLNMNEYGRKRLVAYVKRDAELAVSILRQGASLLSYMEMARVTGLNISSTFERGQMIRFWSLLLRYCRRAGVIVPSLAMRGDSQMQEGSYVMMPEVGYYTQDAVAVLDFASLYPSIIIGHNLSYDTIVRKEDTVKLDPNDWEAGMGPEECYFVKPHVKKGIVPAILEQLISERKRVKELMQETTDPGMRLIYNSRQQALKTCSNASYGFTGAPTSQLQSLAIAETVITRAATMLQESITFINEHYTTEKGFPVDAHVVYGDTDSLFVKFPQTSVEDAMLLGKRIAKEMSTRFVDPVELKFETVYFPILLINRKRYAGLSWTDAKHSQLVAKGVESQRRDSCALLSWIMLRALKMLFPEANNGTRKITAQDEQVIIGQVVEFIKDAVQRMLKGEFDIGQFVISKGLWLGTETGDYKQKQAHVELAEKMRQRGKVFVDGERISYVYLTSGNKAFEKVEDPLYAIQNGLALDYPYYLQHQIVGQMGRLLELILDSHTLASLWTGEHTKVAAPKTPSKLNTGPMMKFIQKSDDAYCLNCRAKCAKEFALCERCRPNLLVVYEAVQASLNVMGEERNRLYAMCRACQGHPYDVLCENLECSIYYRRLKSDEEFDKIQEKLLRLQLANDW
jgi:DNA polymerase delta subunit 1